MGEQVLPVDPLFELSEAATRGSEWCAGLNLHNEMPMQVTGPCRSAGERRPGVEPLACAGG